MGRLLARIWEWLLDLFGLEKKAASTNKSAAHPQSSQAAVAPVTSTSAPELVMGSGEPPQYRKNKSLFTYRERVFYAALRRAVGNQYQIFAKVRLADFIWLTNEPADRKYHNNQINCKHVDFLLCSRYSHEPLLAIELDDSSHKQPDAQGRDKFKNDTFSAIGLPLLRVELQPEYETETIRQLIRSKIAQ
jgi:hypothetical protein